MTQNVDGIAVRPITEAELEPFCLTLARGFLEHNDPVRIAAELRPLWDFRRVYAAFDGDRMCGTFRTWATEVTVPGCARLPASAVTAVTVLPTHRRRGVMRDMLALAHAGIRERGEALAVLHAAEATIYERFGYGPACTQAAWRLDVRTPGFTTDGPLRSVELVMPDTVARDQVKAVFEAWRQRQPGEVRRVDYRWDFELGLKSSAWGDDWKGFLALHRAEDGAADGYVRYTRGQETWVDGNPRSPMRVDELHALTDTAYRDLWRFLAEMDWVATVTAERRRVAEDLPWLLANPRDAVLTEVGDGLWLRIMDVPKALAARTYEREDRLVIDVIDGEASGGRTRVALDAGPNGATCTTTTREPDLTVDIAALSSAYLGERGLRAATIRSGVDEATPGALDRADRLFRTFDAPWCSTFF